MEHGWRAIPRDPQREKGREGGRQVDRQADTQIDILYIRRLRQTNKQKPEYSRNLQPGSVFCCGDVIAPATESDPEQAAPEGVRMVFGCLRRGVLLGLVDVLVGHSATN